MTIREKPCGARHPLPCGTDIECGGCPWCGGELDAVNETELDDGGAEVTVVNVYCTDCGFHDTGTRFYRLEDV